MQIEIELDLPPSWRRAGDAVFQDGAGKVLTVGPLAPWPDDWRRAEQALLAASLRGGQRLRGVERVQASTRTGFPMLLVWATVADEQGGLAEERLLVWFEVLEYAAAALLCGPAGLRDDAGPIVELLRAAQPRSSGVRALADLVSGFESAPD